MKKKLIVLVLVFVMCISSTALAAEEKKSMESAEITTGTTYYISSSMGNDDNDGLSADRPWKSFAKLPDLDLEAGDQVLLKCGDSWMEHFTLNSPVGTEENPVVISSYGKGEKPKLTLFEGEVPKYAGDPLMYIVNAEGLEINGLDIGYCGVGINFDYNLEVDKDYIKISECHFHDIYGFYQLDREGITKFPHATGIVVTGRAPVPGAGVPFINGLYIDKCTSYDAGALYTYGTTVGVDHAVYGLYVTNCVMENNGIYGISIAGVQGGYMDNCKIVDCGSRYAPMGSMGIMLSCEDYTVMNCDIGFQQRLEDNPDGGGIDFEHLTYDVDFINNYIHDNSGVGVMFYSSGADASHQNKRIRFLYNVFENNNQNVYKPGGSELISQPLYSLVDGAIYNNKYMESRNMFTMYMDASVDVRGNEAYPEELQGKVWPLLDFDVVRDYVINGAEINTDGIVAVESIPEWTEYVGYAVGFAGGLVLLTIIGIIWTIIKKCKKRKAVLCGILSVLMLSTFVPNSALASGEVYKLSEMLSENTDTWQYYWHSGKEYMEMEYADGEWNGGTKAHTAIVGKEKWHPYISGYTVVAFNCPASGTVKVGMEKPLEVNAITMDGVYFSVISELQLISDMYLLNAENPKQEFETLQFDVYEGQVIYFFLNMNVNNSGDSTTITPYIQYTEYKEVEPSGIGDVTTQGDETEPVLKTDIKPLEISGYDGKLVYNPIQIAVGAAVPLGIGVLILICSLIKKKGGMKHGK